MNGGPSVLLSFRSGQTVEEKADPPALRKDDKG